jgi:hypothetical protein
VQFATSANTKPPNATSVLWNLRLKQNDVKQGVSVAVSTELAAKPPVLRLDECLSCSGYGIASVHAADTASQAFMQRLRHRKRSKAAL